MEDSSLYTPHRCPSEHVVYTGPSWWEKVSIAVSDLFASLWDFLGSLFIPDTSPPSLPSPQAIPMEALPPFTVIEEPIVQETTFITEEYPTEIQYTTPFPSLTYEESDDFIFSDDDMAYPPSPPSQEDLIYTISPHITYHITEQYEGGGRIEFHNSAPYPVRLQISYEDDVTRVQALDDEEFDVSLAGHWTFSDSY